MVSLVVSLWQLLPRAQSSMKVTMLSYDNFYVSNLEQSYEGR